MSIKGVYRGGHGAVGPSFGVQVMNKYLILVRKIESWPPPRLEFEQKIWIEKRAFFLGLHLNLGRKTGEFCVKIFFLVFT